MKKYQPQEFEKKWIDWWDEENVYKTDSPSSKSSGHEPRTNNQKQKKYVLDMFPYPSGAGLHVGHPRGYTATDIVARHYRMSGYQVLHPMGWDAFGLPAENRAIKEKRNPMDMVPENIATFKRQMKMLGFSYDWSREFATTDPGYYGITQKLFIEFYKAGLLYKKNTQVYFCDKCKTGLAEEEVLPDGTHERCGTAITRKELPQWIFRITTYADSLLAGLKDLKWPTGIIEMQRNWIGRKEGINIEYKVKGTEEKIICFTTRPDTNFGATFVVVAPEHHFVKKILDGKLEVSPTTKEQVVQYVKVSLAKTDLERQAEGHKKTGVFTGFHVVNNLTGKLMPVWISDFVLSAFGTGAVVGVPGHDIRDFEFAKEFNLEIIRVVKGVDGDMSEITELKQVQEKEGTLVNSDFLNGLEVEKAIKAMIDHLEEKGWGKRVVSYHLRDWIFSRQRYWGEPIPMVHCEKCEKNKIAFNFKKLPTTDSCLQTSDYQLPSNMYGWFPLSEKELPLKLPYVQSYEPTGTGESPLAAIPTFVKTTCPNCGGEATRETDTMPNWAGSCWYFLAFASDKTFDIKKNKDNIENWLPVDWYVGGAEHAVLHLLYSRFWMHVLNDMGLINFREPFIRLHNVGMILAEDHRKMSKSFGNVVNPDDVVAEYGADALRMYEMFMAPFSQEIAWSTTALQGTHRFLKRVWDMFYVSLETGVGSQESEDKNLVSKLNKTIKKVAEDIIEFKFNTAIAAMMEFLNAWESISQKTGVGGLKKENAEKFLKMLAPFAPFTTEEIWQTVLGKKGSIHLASWPAVDEKAFVLEAKKIAVQVNGKVRAVIEVDSKTSENQNLVIEKAKSVEHVKKYLGAKKYTVVYVPGRVLNFVLSS